MKLKKELNTKNETLLDADSISEVNQTISKLSESHDGMMNWKRSFSQNFPAGFLVEGIDKGNHEMDRNSEEMGYEDLHQKLQEELVKIQSVDQQMDKAIAKAESIKKTLGINPMVIVRDYKGSVSCTPFIFHKRNLNNLAKSSKSSTKEFDSRVASSRIQALTRII